MMIPIGRCIGFGPRRLAEVLWRPALAAVALLGTVLVVRALLPATVPAWQALVVLALAAATVYATVAWLVDQRGIQATWRYIRS
jgi:hypothetical protein